MKSEKRLKNALVFLTACALAMCGMVVEPEPAEEAVQTVEERSDVDASYFRRAGVIYGDDGTRYTWYSQNVLPGGGLTELNSNGRHVDEQGYIRDGDGYIAVASEDYAMGTVLDTPFGQAKVYDCGCASGTVDVYVDF